MLIYGTRSAHLATKKLQRPTCQSCNTKGEIVMGLYRKHVHAFWIPLFPYKKTAVSECGHCKHTIEKKEFNEELNEEYRRIKEHSKGPVWQFSGLLLIALLIAYGSYASNQDKANELLYLGQPEVGDVYSYVMEEGNYSTFKITSVSTDSVFFILNDYEISRASKIYKINKEENYSDAEASLAKSELDSMYKNNDIIDIIRD
ncbi:MAG: hypothetical protein BM564_01010 [Bacteroidetes bacterium MedPE-SWsnd-G2]|nr:MAG: hypothetical protein BM564_01010 [Bacteroidetes bacterium MedPE-SWsnd-G2]